MTETAALGTNPRSDVQKHPFQPTIKVLVSVPLLLFVAIAVNLINTTRFPAPDELEHVSYAAHLQETGRTLPQFKEQNTLASEDLCRWEARPNYIGHPSPYYVFISWFLTRSLSPQNAVFIPRLASLGLLLFGLTVALWAGMRVFKRDKLALAVFCIGLTFCPELLSISRQVTNDSLAFLGGALAYWGACTSGRRRWSSDAGVALGLMLALWAKPNAGLEVGLFLAVVIALQQPCFSRVVAWITIGGLVGSLPYILIVLDHAAVIPVTAENVRGVRHMQSFADYLPAFVFNVGYTWGFISIPIWPVTMNGILISAAFWIMMGFTVLGAWPARLPLSARHTHLAAAGVMAFVLVLPIHLWFASANLGYSVPAASFRYYLPLWPALIHALACAVQDAGEPWRRVTAACVGGTAVALGWIL